MKPVFLVIALLIVLLPSKKCGAQNANTIPLGKSDPGVNFKVIFPGTKTFDGSVGNVNVTVLNDFVRCNKILSEIKITRVNIKAVRHFTRFYQNIPDAKWFKTEGGYVANFLSNGIYSKIAYTDNGRWFYNLFDYTEGKLDFEIRHMVKSKYYDHDILMIHQYEFDNNKTVYIIRIQDKQSQIINLKVYDGQIEDITQPDNTN